MNPVLNLILTSGFLITEEAALGYIPFVVSLLNGNHINEQGLEQKRALNQPYIATANINTTSRYELNNGSAPIDSILVLPVIGEITKYSQWCGPRGTMELAADIKRMNNNTNIIGAVLEIDSPGGEAAYTDIVSQVIKDSKKPVIAHVNGMAASAAYWIASACSEIIVESKNDMLGSIGTMIMFWDLQEYWKKEGIKLQTVYATLSTEKNKDYHDLMKGDFDGYRKKRLDPLNESFHEAIKDNRNGKLSGDKDIFSGATFNAKEAITRGLADGFGSFDVAVNRAYALGIEHKNKKKDSQISNKTIVYV